MTDPAVYSRMVDDFCPPAEKFQPKEFEEFLYALVYDDAQLLGLFLLTPVNGVTVEVHTCLLPCAYGSKAARAAVAMARWVWEHTLCHRIMTNVPVHNRLALRFALSAGMEIFGRNSNSFMCQGKLEDLILLGLSRPQG